jgi:uncharacterized protein YggT (Ycf19 family)
MIEKTVVRDDETIETLPTDDVYAERPVSARDDHRMNVAARAIWFVGGVIMALLALRFLLRLLGANPANGFADFIYTVSHPFAAPFFGLFSYTADLARGRFEFETLIAIVVYGLIAWGLARLVTLGKR